MGGRPWLEALKEHCDRREQGRGTRDAIFADAQDDEPTKPTKAFAPVVDIDATRACFARDENARRLLAAGSTPKERMHSHGKGLRLMVDLKSIAVCSNWTMLQPLRNDPS